MTSPAKQACAPEDTGAHGDATGADAQNQNQFAMPMEVFRELYKTEIHVLWQEVERFRKLCQRQMAKQRMLLTEHRQRCEEEYGEQSRDHSAPDLPNDFSRELRKLDENMTFLESSQSSNQDKKRQESKRHMQQQVIQSTNSTETPPTQEGSRSEDLPKAVEILLNAEAIQVEPEQLPEELELKEDLLKVELARTLKHLDLTDSESLSVTTGEETLSETTSAHNESSNKARKHWMIARKHLVDKLALLETTVKRYRSELAAATMTITSKEMEISHLNKQVTELRGEVKKKDKKIEELEHKLVNTLEDKNRSERNLEMFMDELQNIELHTCPTHVVEEDPEQTNPPTKQQQPSFKQRLLRKQHSSLSFFGPSKDKSSRSRLGERASPGASGESTPDKESPQMKRRSSHPPISEDRFHTNGTKDVNTQQILNEILGKDHVTNNDEQVDQKAQYGVDNSSRACAVM